jgi:ankyrin repeat protein
MKEMNKEVFTLLIEACKDGDLECVKKYLSKDNIEGTESYTPLKGAISLRQYNILEYLLSQGANPNR